jgi:hypothetical protein|tara:strand:- start:2125 stop:2421 length:297 start_codon:yes stop_codon:yes gene_type:complete
MAYGLKIWNSSGDVRLDTTDRQVKVNSFYQGVLPAGGGSTTVTGITGFDLSDPTWSINVQPASMFISLTTSSGSFTITRSSDDYSITPLGWKLIVFRT